MEPRFNEVPRDRGNLFILSRVHYIEHLHLKNFQDNYQNVCYIEVKLIINLQNPAFPNLKNYCYNISVPSQYIPMTLETQEQANKLLKTTIHMNFILVGLIGIHLLPHARIYLLYRGKFYVCHCGLCSL